MSRRYNGRMIVTIAKTFGFEAGHSLPRVPAEHKCRRPHGHSYRVTLELTGEVDPHTGWLIDFARVADIFEPIRAQLDHQHLNDVAGLANPTSENIAVWLWQRIKPALPLLSAVVVHETPENSCEYRGE